MSTNLRSRSSVFSCARARGLSNWLRSRSSIVSARSERRSYERRSYERRSLMLCNILMKYFFKLFKISKLFVVVSVDLLVFTYPLKISAFLISRLHITYCTVQCISEKHFNEIWKVIWWPSWYYSCFWGECNAVYLIRFALFTIGPLVSRFAPLFIIMSSLFNQLKNTICCV